MTDSIVVFIISALSGMGVGGGGLPVIYFTLARGVPQKQAQGMNLILFICAVSAAVVFGRKKRRADVKTILVLAGIGCLFAVFGSLLALKLSPSVLRILFGIFLVLTGIKTVLEKNEK